MKYLYERVGDDIILAQLERREDALRTASDAIDTRAGHLLTAAALLAVGPATVLVQNGLLALIVRLEAVTCVLLALSFALAWMAIGELKLPAIGVTDAWRESVFHAVPAGRLKDDGPALLVWALIEGCRDRIRDIDSSNKERRLYLRFARLVMIGAVLTTAWSLFGIAAQHQLF